MTDRTSADFSGLVISVASGLTDIARVLVTLDRPVEQIGRALERARDFIPYDRCALLRIRSERGHDLTVVPEATNEDRDRLRERLSARLELLAEKAEPPSLPHLWPDFPTGPAHLEVPLIVGREVVGILRAERARGRYEAHHGPLLSAVAAQLAGYVTKLRSSEQEERAGRGAKRSAALLEHVRDGFLEFDFDERCVSANPSALELLGTNRVVVGATAEELLSFAENRAFVEALDRAIVGRVGTRLEAEYLPEGERWWEGDVYPTEIGASLFIRDISERRRAEEFRDLLVGIIGHDLRTPLAAITLTAESLLHRKHLDQDTKRAVARVARSGARMEEMITQLLDLTRIRIGRTLPIRRREARLDKICRQVADEVSRSYPDRTIESELQDELHGMWDADRLAQVVSNLLENAVKHGRAGTPVRIRAWQGPDDNTYLSVHNEGPPIPDELLPTLFQAFREAGRRAAEDSTLGLGLFIARTVVEAHGGTLRVASASGSGTTFTVRLPRVAPGPSPLEQRAPRWRAAKGHPRD